MKRYTIFNFYIRGGNQLPQGCHVLNNLWKQVDSCPDQMAVANFKDWAFNHETEVVLQGGDDEKLENLYTALSNIKGILSSKFNEPGIRNACAAVSFIATSRIVAGVNFARENRLNPANIKDALERSVFTPSLENPKKIEMIDRISLNDNDYKIGNFSEPSEEEIFVISNIAFLPLA
ncbi:MAG: hypothetical protein K2X69_14420 [Silvanigrellaceae bacterium]|nr:hypothetical protein [Silvanigrellaceae bacterium]